MERIKDCPLCGSVCEIEIRLTGKSESSNDFGSAALEIEAFINCDNCGCNLKDRCHNDQKFIYLNKLSLHQVDDLVQLWNSRTVK